MKRKLRQAYIRGMIDLTMYVTFFGTFIWFLSDVAEKYFM